MRCELYIRLLEKHRPGRDWTIAEIGVWKGDLGFTFLDMEPRIKKYYAVDPYRVYDSTIQDKRGWTQAQWDSFYETITMKFERFGDRIQFVREESCVGINLVEGEVDMAYIDGDHSYEAVKKDIKIWYEKVCEGGILAGHDYDYGRYPEVTRAVNEFANSKGKYLTAGTRRSADWFIIK